jgi:hypothetical protein
MKTFKLTGKKELGAHYMEFLHVVRGDEREDFDAVWRMGQLGLKRPLIRVAGDITVRTALKHTNNLVIRKNDVDYILLSMDKQSGRYTFVNESGHLIVNDYWEERHGS